MAKSTPLGVIFSLLPSLSAKDLEKLKAQLTKETPCERTGHVYKPASKIERWFNSPLVKMVCVRCGSEKIV